MAASIRRHRQRGIALLTVMAAVLMCIAVVLASAHTGLLHEMLTGNDSDQLRARAAAEALVRDAEADIRGVRADATPCRPASDASDASDANGDSATGYVGCRQRGPDQAFTAPWFPRDDEEFDQVAALVGHDAALPCLQGICVPVDLTTLDHLEDSLAQTTAVAATYGQFTHQGTTGSGTAANPVLAARPARAWYWTEALRYDVGRDTAAQGVAATPDPTRPFVYRITAVALGLKPGTRAVVKSYFVPYPSSQLQ